MRLMGGESGTGYEYGRLEIFMHGFWSNICSRTVFSPDSTRAACQELGFDGGAALQFPQAFRFGTLNRVCCLPHCGLLEHDHICSCVHSFVCI